MKIQIDKLDTMLKKAGIPFERNDAINEEPSFGDRYMRRIAYPSKDNRVCSAIQGYGSYGEKQNRIEMLGILTKEGGAGDVEGGLTAEEVFNRIRKHWEGNTT